MRCCRMMLGLAVLASLLGTQAMAATYVSGSLIDQKDGGPVAGATVALMREGEGTPVGVATSLPNASFLLKAPGPGQYRLRAAADGFFTLDQILSVPAAGLSGLHLALSRPHPLHVRLGGGARPLRTSEPVETWLWLLAEDQQAWFLPAIVTAAPGGMVEVAFPSKIPLSEFEKVRGIRVEVRCPAGCGGMTLEQWPVGPVTLPLSAGLSISGVVQERDGKVVPGADITAYRALRPGWILPNPEQMNVKADEAGRFVLPALFAEGYRLRIRLNTGKEYFRDAAPSLASLVVGPHDPEWVNEHYGIPNEEVACVPVIERLYPERILTMPPVSGRIVESGTGAPVAHATVTIMPAWDKLRPTWRGVDVAWSDANGRFQLRALAPGQYRVQAEGPEQFRYFTNVEVAPGGATSLISLAPVPRLRIHLVGADGKPVKTGQLNIMSRMSAAGQVYENEVFKAGEDDGAVEIRPYTWMTVSRLTDLSNIGVAVRSERQGVGFIHLDSWPDRPATLRLEHGLSLKGRVRSADGKIAAVAHVEVYPLYQRVEAVVCRGSAETDADGHFEIKDLLPGGYNLHAYWNGEELSREIMIPLPDAAKGEASITLVAAPHRL